MLDLEANERSIAHKLAEYLQIEFPEYEVDCEYNRFFKDPKILDVFIEKIGVSKRRLVIPDIIIHKRGNDSHKLLVIEVKKNLEDFHYDEDKLKAFTSQPEYAYKFGVLLVFDKSGNDILCKLFVYKNGQKIREKEII